MAKKLVPPETWQGIPVIPGEFQSRYWISEENDIAVLLNAKRNGSYEIMYSTHNVQFILSDEKGNSLYVKAQRDFLPLMDLARVGLVEHYEEMVQSAKDRVEAALKDVKDRQACLDIVAHGVPKQARTFWERLG